MSLDASYKLDRKLAASLTKVWDAFFSRHGRLTDIQRKAIPPLLEGRNVVACSPTASGKTEAACAPLVQRALNLHRLEWTILYISPTRALVNDLYARLEPPLAHLGLEIVRRTGDHRTRLESSPHVLLTTPESFDSLMCRGVFPSNDGHALARVFAVVLDEIHLLHGSPRGEMLRWLLHRLRLLKDYAASKGWCRGATTQVVALSATLSNPASIVSHYLGTGEILTATGTREIQVLAQGKPIERTLTDYVVSLKTPEKLLVFCNSRKRADTLTHRMAETLLQQHYVCAVHHGSLSKNLREVTEELFHQEKRIVVFATSTLELGIDIGDIDVVILDGAPPDVNSLLQRIGRGNRRSKLTRVILCSDDKREALFHDALLAAARQRVLSDPYQGPHHSVAVQQVASYVFQAPDRHRERVKIETLLAACAPTVLLQSLLPHMLQTEELRPRGSSLCLGQDWIERAEKGTIHSVIESAIGSTLVDEQTGAALATGINYRGGRKLHLLGKEFEVKALDSANRVVIGEPGKANTEGAQWNYVSNPRSRFQRPAREVREFLGIPKNDWVLCDERVLFHFGGRRRQKILEVLAPPNAPIGAIDDFAIYFLDPCKPPLAWLLDANRATVEAQIPSNLDSLEHALGLPYASARLPLAARVDQILGFLDIDNEIQSVRTARIVTTTTSEQRQGLLCLMGRQ